jgi:hypothetical protein
MVELVRGIDVLGAHLGVEAIRERIAIGEDAAAGTRARLEHGDAEARLPELVRGGEPGQARAQDHDLRRDGG